MWSRGGMQDTSSNPKKISSPRRVFAHSCRVYRRIFDGLASEVVRRQYFSDHPKQGLSRARVEHLKGTIKWVLSALWDAHSVGLDSAILPLGKSAFAGRVYGEKATRTALDLLERDGWTRTLIARSGLYVSDASEILATASLADHFDKIGFVWIQQEYETKSEVLVLRRKDSFLDSVDSLQIPVGPAFNRMRDDVHRINRMTLRYAVFPYLPDNVLNDLRSRSDKKHCNFARVVYRRIFSEGRFDRGGRFFGPWWQSIPREYREQIRIDGEQTVELDFKGTFFELLYARRGGKLQGDPYDLGLDVADKSEARGIVKKFANSMLNDHTGRYTPGKEALDKLGLTRDELLRRLKERHPLVADAFEMGLGLSLMYSESEIARKVMLEMSRRGLPVLNIHDGFITQERHLISLEKVMSDAFFKVAGVRPVIDNKGSSQQLPENGSYAIYTKYMSTFFDTKRNALGLVADKSMFMEKLFNSSTPPPIAGSRSANICHA